jgi:uncharacterized protein YciI
MLLIEFLCQAKAALLLQTDSSAPNVPTRHERQRETLDGRAWALLSGALAAGRVLLFGPVMASSGAFGLGILEVDSEQEAREFGEGDPSVQAGLNKFEIHPMLVSAARAKGQ